MQPQPLRRRLPAEPRNQIVEQRTQRKARRVRDDPTRIQLGDVEQRAQQLLGGDDRTIDPLDQRLLPLAGERRREETRRMERLEQVMAGGREEARLVTGRGGQRRIGLRQRGGAFADAGLERIARRSAAASAAASAVVSVKLMT